MKAWLSVYYKLKILPGLVWSRHEVGLEGGAEGTHICVSVALNFNSWRLERPGGGWGSTSLWGERQVGKKACAPSVCTVHMSERVCVFDYGRARTQQQPLVKNPH